MSSMSLPISVPVNSSYGSSLEIEIFPGKPIIILGHNGSGKSALLQYFLRHIPQGQYRYLSGHRTNWFSSNALQMTSTSRNNIETNFRQYVLHPEARWKDMYGSQRNEAAIYDMLSADVKYNLDAVEEIKRVDCNTEAVISRLKNTPSPIDKLNALLRLGNLPIQLHINNRTRFSVIRGDYTYSIAEMSDGERNAVIVSSDILTADPDSIIVIDEPERHLHRSIIVPLLSALILERPDCRFLLSTHELCMPEAIPEGKILLVRDCSWVGNQVKTWDLDLLDAGAVVGEDIRRDILGSRRKMLFVEGVYRSLDTSLYSLLFPNVTINPKGSCREVMRAVQGLRAGSVFHHLEVFGLLDRDDREPSEIGELGKQGLFALDVYSVESLYYSREVCEAVAKRQAETFNLSCDEILTTACEKALEKLKDKSVMEQLASHRCERIIHDRIRTAVPCRKELLMCGDKPIEISINSPIPAELSRYRALLDEKDLDGIISRYPVRQSPVLAVIANSLHCADQSYYERAALAAVDARDDVKTILRAKLGKLSVFLRDRGTADESL